MQRLARYTLKNSPSSVRVSVDISLGHKRAFAALADELQLSLENRGITIRDQSNGGRIMEGDSEIGIVQEWNVGKRISFSWHPKIWERDSGGRLVVTFKPKGRGTTVTLELVNWGRVLGDEKAELLGWFANEVAGPFLWASAPNRLGDWITDRHARRPSGARSRGVYRNPTHHWPNFYAILDALALKPGDNLLEVGCGGGAFLHEALKSGCRASAIDHSPDMVRLATQQNLESITEGKLKISLGEADSLPYKGSIFTCVVMTSVLGFLPNALVTFKEIYRVLADGGRLVTFSGSKALRGTHAAPEPIASRLHFYEASEIEDLARRAGFGVVKVEHPSLYEYAKKAGLRQPDLDLFKGSGRDSQLLIASKARSK